MRFSLFIVQALVAGALLGPGASAWAQAKPVTVWMSPDLPPGFMPVEGRPTDGFVDTLLKMIFVEMPESEHRLQVTPIARTWASLSEGLPMCFTAAVITPERERIAYATPLLLIPPQQLVVRESVVSGIPRNAQGEVLPATLFDRADLRGLVTPQRSYSVLLDTLLARRGPQSGVREASVTPGGSNILQMLSLGRADYTIEFEQRLTYQLPRQPTLQRGEKLLVLPIAGMQPVQVGIACPHTEWGRAMILRIDAIVARVSQRPEYQKALNRWLSPDAVKRFRKAQDEFFRMRAQRTDPAKYPIWGAEKPEK